MISAEKITSSVYYSLPFNTWCNCKIFWILDKLVYMLFHDFVLAVIGYIYAPKQN